MNIKAFFDPPTFTLTYVVYDSGTRDAVIIDPVLDFEPLTWRISESAITNVEEFVAGESLKVRWILDTHAHADHLSGMNALKARLAAPTAIGRHITAVQKRFSEVYNMPELPVDGSQWDQLLDHDQEISAGSLVVKALHTPGHTPACMSFLIGDAVFTGDALFMPDYGTGRCDFPGGSAEDLYDSVTHVLYKLPASTRAFVGHDYQPGGRELAYETTIGDSLERNVRLHATTKREAFVSARRARDKELSPPRFILQSLQVNIDAGRLPRAESNGKRYLKMPINFLGV